MEWIPHQTGKMEFHPSFVGLADRNSVSMKRILLTVVPFVLAGY